MFNLYTFAFLLLILITVISLWNYTQKFTARITLYHYKIVSFIKTFFIIILYIFVFIIILYYLRIMNIGKVLDIKALYSTISILYVIFIKPLSVIHTFYIVSLTLLGLLLLFFMLRIIILKVKLEIFKVYIYVLCKPRTGISLKKQFKYTFFFENIGDLDIISYIIFNLVRNLVDRLPKKGFIIKTGNLVDNLQYNKTYKNKYNLFIKLTPLFFIIYDCIFNNFILIHVYYYLLIYIPLMLFLTITKAMAETNEGFADILWQIYYNNPHNIKYIANNKQLELINCFLQVKVSYIIDLCLDMVEFSLQNEITYYLQDPVNKIYINNNIVYLKIDSQKIFLVTEDDQGNPIFTETTDYRLL